MSQGEDPSKDAAVSGTTAGDASYPIRPFLCHLEWRRNACILYDWLDGFHDNMNWISSLQWLPFDVHDHGDDAGLRLYLAVAVGVRISILCVRVARTGLASEQLWADGVPILSQFIKRAGDLKPFESLSALSTDSSGAARSFISRSTNITKFIVKKRPNMEELVFLISAGRCVVYIVADIVSRSPLQSDVRPLRTIRSGVLFDSQFEVQYALALSVRDDGTIFAAYGTRDGLVNVHRISRPPDEPQATVDGGSGQPDRIDLVFSKKLHLQSVMSISILSHSDGSPRLIASVSLDRRCCVHVFREDGLGMLDEDRPLVSIYSKAGVELNSVAILDASPDNRTVRLVMGGGDSCQPSVLEYYNSAEKGRHVLFGRLEGSACIVHASPLTPNMVWSADDVGDVCVWNVKAVERRHFVEPRLFSPEDNGSADGRSQADDKRDLSCMCFRHSGHRMIVEDMDIHPLHPDIVASTSGWVRLRRTVDCEKLSDGSVVMIWRGRFFNPLEDGRSLS